MYDKILVPMALDHGVSEMTLATARTLLSADGEIVALHVYEAPQGSVSVYLDEETVKAGFNAACARLTKRLETFGDVTPVLLKGHAARTIIDYANQNEFDCIVIGSHKPDLRDFLLGSTAARVVRHADCAVHVQRTRA